MQPLLLDLDVKKTPKRSVLVITFVGKWRNYQKRVITTTDIFVSYLIFQVFH
jgi:hypothetical protein